MATPATRSGNWHPDPIRPMLATSGGLPGHDDAHAYEVKWDGVRAIAHASPQGFVLQTRNLRDVTEQYPEVRGILRQVAREAPGGHAALDGEIVALDERGLPSFERLQRRMHVTDPALVERRMREAPVVYVAFDLLRLGGESLMDRPYVDRRRALEALRLEGPAWRTSTAWPGGGADLLAASRDLGLEGIVAKRRDSRYVPGKRSRAWIKVKNRLRQEFVIGGWTPGAGARSGRPGALLVGYHDGEGRLRYAGKVGTGYTEADLARLAGLLAPLRRGTCPFVDAGVPADARFVEPLLVGDVEFHEWTAEGKLRHPSFKGLRTDKEPSEVVREGMR